MQPAKLDGWSRSAIGFPHIIVTEKEDISKLPWNQSVETQLSLIMDSIGKYNAVENKNYLKKHLKTREKIIDVSDNEWQCKYCEKKFTTKGNFKKHLNESHLKTSRYKCEICGKGFDVKSKLERHVKSPTVHIVKPFKCDYCPVTFNNKKTRTSHVKEFHLNQN